MDPYRTRKLNQSILEVLSDLLQVAVKDPRVGFVTLSRVKLNRDHSVAEVFWSIMGDEQETKQSLEGLKRARGFMQGKVGRLLGLRQVPQLRFVHDDSLARGLEMDDLLRKLEQEGEFLTEDQKRRQLKLEDLQPPSELIQGLRNVGSCWIVPHFNPDPDAMGSALALAEALVAMGRQVRVFGYPDPPTGLSDLPGFASTVSSEDAAELYAQEKPDTLILVDCHRVDRCGPLEDLLDRFETRLCIDHHLVSNRKAPDPGWVEWRACSTCTLVHQVIQVLAAGGGAGGDEPFELSLDMATNLFAGLLNDTGGFRFNNTMPLTFDLAGRLSAMGVDTGQVAHMTLHRYRPVGLALLELVLATFQYYAGGQILLARATQEMLAETGGLLSDTEGFVNIATAVDGVRFVAFMKEIEADTWRVSLRAREQGDVQTIAARYGGGGHKQAAGCTIPGESAEVVSMIVADLTAALES